MILVGLLATVRTMENRLRQNTFSVADSVPPRLLTTPPTEAKHRAETAIHSRPKVSSRIFTAMRKAVLVSL